MEGSQPSVLVVDDESDTLLSLFDTLSAAAYFVEGCSNALDALKLQRRRPYDVVLADARMPEMGGLELIDRIKALFPGTRVILVGLSGDEDLREASLSKGGEGVLIKPVRKEDLLGALRRAIRPAPVEGVGPLQVSR